jgi:hypothetical protein
MICGEKMARPGITRSLASFVVKPFVTFLKKALKNKVETVKECQSKIYVGDVLDFLVGI